MLIFFFHLEKNIFAAARVKLFLATRSSGIKAIFFWHKLKNVDIGISYEKLLSIENCLAGHVMEETKGNHGIYLSRWTIPDKFILFTIDNIDFRENTPSGMNTLHGTAISIYQEKTQDGKFERKDI